MALILTAATLKDATRVQATYPQVEKTAIEVEANNIKIQAIRSNLETLFNPAKNGSVE
ncbi:MAG: hypothetical protein ACJAYB_001222 [Psychromonas sp.]|jgi:hypothetical protein